MNPWISIWTSPRKTIAHIVSQNPKRGLWLLAAIYGFLSLLNGFQSSALGNAAHAILIIILAIIFSPVWGMIIFGIWSWVVYRIGKLLKGQSSFAFVRAAFAWSCVPLVINIALWILLVLIFGTALFQSDPLTGSMGLLLGVLVIKVVVLVWSLVIFINALAEVQKISIGRSIANIVLAWIAIALVITLIWLGLGFITNASMTSAAIFNLTSRM